MTKHYTPEEMRAMAVRLDQAEHYLDKECPCINDAADMLRDIADAIESDAACKVNPR